MAGVPIFATGPGFIGRPITGIGTGFTVGGIRAMAVADTGEFEILLGDLPRSLALIEAQADPAFAPGTGTPEVGGLASWQTEAIMRRLATIPFVGMDVVEVLPAHDVSEITALAAATVIWEYLALVGRPEGLAC